MKLADGVEMLEIMASFMGRQSAMYPVVVYDKDEVTLVDTGFPRSDSVAQIRSRMLQAGIPFERLSKVIITRQDIDHIGGLPELIGETPQKIEVLAHTEEKPYIEGARRLVKISHTCPR